MEALYPFFITFIIIFLAELGDKTQLLVLSFTAKSKTRNILLGVALGTFFSHGLAILFGSNIGGLQNEYVLFVLKVITYLVFLILGIIGFLPEKNVEKKSEKNLINFLGHSSLNYVFIIAITIMVGELGDKTFLASLGLGFEYPNFKIALIAGAVFGMIVSNFIAILFGNFLKSKISERNIKVSSNLIFILFGLIGIVMLFIG